MAVAFEMKVFEEQINLPLLVDIIDFVADTAKADYTQRKALYQRCIFRDNRTHSNDFQEKYGFLYLGELLERYEERFGMSDQDRRAIALALGYTRGITTNEMFVGNQKTVFLQELCRRADGDIYLTGALYLLNAGQSSEQSWLDPLYEVTYKKTEELIFVLSLLPDFEQAFYRFSAELTHLLGYGRRMPVMGNMWILAWITEHIQSEIKTMRGGNFALLRALCALPVSFVKEGSKQYNILLGYGYTSLEIAYMNTMMPRYWTNGKALRSDSIVTEKIIIDLFQRVLAQQASLPQDIYSQLSELFRKYKEFRIRCYGHSGLLEALCGCSPIQNTEIFIWFTTLAPLEHSAFSGFDIMDEKWDGLATGLSEEAYLTLFENGLTSDLDKATIQSHIDRYDTLTGKKYLDVYQETNDRRKFSLLVKMGIIDLWSAFQKCIDKDGNVLMPKMLKRIQSYLREIETVQAFQFYQRFLPKYGFDGYHQFLKPEYNDFCSGLIKIGSYDKNVASIKLDQDFLKKDTESYVTLIQWLEEYLFQYRPSAYISFIGRLLQNEVVANLLPENDGHMLFNLVSSHSGLNWHEVTELKQRYWTPEELAAEKAAHEAAAQKAAEKEEQKLIQDIQAEYPQKTDRTFESVRKFMDRYNHLNKQGPIAYQIVFEDLPSLLERQAFSLNHTEIIHFLNICIELLHKGPMCFSEVQTYISKIKEVAANGTESNSDS